MNRFICAFGLAALAICTEAVSERPALPLGQASPEIMAEASGHYARSRSLLIAAIREFDAGRRIAKPDDLLDPAKWRNTLADRAEDLERLLDPQPRVTEGGIKYSADPRLLPEARRVS